MRVIAGAWRGRRLEALPGREIRPTTGRVREALFSILGARIVGAEVAEFYSHLCPAGVYERVGDALRVNAPNCVDCKATDVLGPRWAPREGGSGPKYRMM